MSQIAMDTLSGRVGRHEILSPLAQDDRGDVYAVKTPAGAHHEIRALKALAGLSDIDKARTALTREAVRQAELDHPQIAKVHEIVDAGDRIAIVSDFVVGEPLKALLRAEEGPLPLPLAVTIASEIALIVARVHSQGGEGQRALVHGDLCPSNVMITYEGEIVVREAGMALTESRLDRTRAGLRGRAGYMSPERARQDLDLDGRTDVYSLGLILHEMLAGEPALGHHEGDALIDAAVKPKITRIASKRKIGRALEQSLIRMLSIEPADRFVSMRELAMALSNLRSVSLGKAELKQELAKLMQRHFNHRARAVRTLMERWKKDKSLVRPNSDARPAPRGASRTGRINTPLPSKPVSPAPMEARLFADLDLAIEEPIEGPLEISSPSRPSIKTELPLESRTDDLSPTSRTGDLVYPRKKLSFLRGVALVVLIVVAISASSWFWPPDYRRAALAIANGAGQQISRLMDESASKLFEHMPQ